MKDNDSNNCGQTADQQCMVEKKRRQGKKPWRYVWLCVVLVLLVAYSFFQLNTQLKHVTAIKNDLKQFVSCLLVQDVDNAETVLTDSDMHIQAVQKALNGPFWRIVEGVPFLGSNVTTARSAMDLVGQASEKLLKPAVEQVRQHPMGAGDSSAEQTVEAVQSYIEFAVAILPDASEIIASAKDLDLGILDRGGRISNLLVTADCAIYIAQSGSEKVLTPLLQQMNRYPLTNLEPAEFVKYGFISGYVEVLENAIPVMKDAVTEIRKNQAAGIDVQYLNTVDSVLALAEDACRTLLNPLCEQLKDHPVQSVIVENGFNAVAISDYLAFVEEVLPDAERILAELQAQGSPFLESNETIAHYLLVGRNLIAFYHQNEDILAVAKRILGTGQDRLYLLAAQNSAETRASGGFPGAMGVIRIQDGILTIGEFAGVNDLLDVYAPLEANITRTEYELFQGEMNVCRDACFCPDFERVAYIWALGYETKNGEALDGVISMTPGIIQKILAPDEEILLSDGTMLTADNATKVLQRDLYFQYFTRTADITKANEIVDALFAETAKKAMSTLISGLSVQKLLGYPEIIREGFADRTLMIWMAKEEDQALIQELGWSGGLNDDENAPAAGVYFSHLLACKTGWFLDIQTEIGDPVSNADGSMTYPLTVSISNRITQEEIDVVGTRYVLGGDGRIRGAVYFFAPAGGSIDNFVAERIGYSEHEYQGLQLTYIRRLDILPGETVQISYDVTTAPGVSAPLTLSQTPTLESYH